MSWIVAMGAGAGLGLVYFGGLWLTISTIVRRPARAAWLPASGAVRLLLLGAGLALLARQGAGSIVAALAGLYAVRTYLLQRLGGSPHGE